MKSCFAKNMAFFSMYKFSLKTIEDLSIEDLVEPINQMPKDFEYITLKCMPIFNYIPMICQITNVDGVTQFAIEISLVGRIPGLSCYTHK